MFTINLGVIKISGDFDREVQDLYKFILIARDNGNIRLNTTAELIVSVIDINDNAPKINNESLKGSIRENMEGEHQIADIDATDADQGSNGELEYSILNSKDLFMINESTGVVTVLKPLDREEQEYYNITVVVKDKGNPSLQSSVILTVKVLDEDDNCPAFKSSIYKGSVKENSKHETFVLQVKATDKDTGPNAVLNFGIITGDGNGAFGIDPTSGRITVIGTVDYEFRKVYHLKVRAGKRDCGDKGNKTNIGEGQTPISFNYTAVDVEITTIDVNDNPPVFANAIEPVVFSNTSTVNIITLNATDLDPGKGGEVRMHCIKNEGFVKEFFLKILSCVDLILTDSPRSFQNTRTIEMGLSGFHKLVAAVLQMYFQKYTPKYITYLEITRTLIISFSIKNKTNENCQKIFQIVS